MKYVISNTGNPFQFAINGSEVYSFDTEDPVAISEEHYKLISDRIGSNCLRVVDAPTSDESGASTETGGEGESSEGESN